MKRLAYVLLVVSSLLLLSACSTKDRAKIQGQDASPDAVPELVGTYSVNGFDPLGTEYGGLLTIQAGAAAGEYQLQWIITGAIQAGTGQLAGNQLQVEWETVEGTAGTARGRTTYTITDRGELYGPRWVEGYDKAGTEQAFPNDDRWGDFNLGPQ